MKHHRLKIGRIFYANLFPVFYTLEREFDCSQYEFVDGFPANLNKIIRNGDIDVSPSSSIEYLRYSDRYNLVEGHSISSFGPIGSITLFSRRPIDKLDGQTVLTSSQSETSVVLLQIIFEKFYKIKCKLRSIDFSLQSSAFNFQISEAYLLIGDDAMKAVKSCKLQVASRNENSKLSTPDSELIYIYDLSELWYKYTGLPFTFALWISRKDCASEVSVLLDRFKNDLDKAKMLALKNLKAIASAYPEKGILTEEELLSYWENISYNLDDEHKKGLELFRKYSKELGLI